eukprot:CAMPEP_0184417616 /NCGR_PEP_ID=MMETSP0738-20130409/15538_1 /TAXON_ID=385413 /ORGANISM="Thalassiosira miniscula, Strain CCMP1093" /LENGTH=131 /DNA_ID=CAMNT_0026777391 /DNA_START=107 /DNA_END=499 /DNA_ORIENTATION=+
MPRDHTHATCFRVEKNRQGVNEFCIYANLGNEEELGIRYSANIWCGDTEVCVKNMEHKETRVDRNSWFLLCVLDLGERLDDMVERGEANAYLRVSLNVVADDASAKNEHHSLRRYSTSGDRKGKLRCIVAW